MRMRSRCSDVLCMPNQGPTCLLLHGRAGSPGHMEPMGRYLHQLGLNVWIPALADDYQPAQLVGAVHGVVERPVVVGFSQGGLLALDLARRGLVRGLVTINAPLQLQDDSSPLAASLARVQGWLSEVTAPALIVQSDDDSVVLPVSGRMLYSGIASLDKRFWSCRGDHLIVLGRQRKNLFAEIGRFVTGLRSGQT